MNKKTHHAQEAASNVAMPNRCRYDEWRRETVSRLVANHAERSDLGGRWRGRPYDHVLRDGLLRANFLPTVDFDRDLSGIDLHEGIGHLNSSQAMCINFFAPLRRRPGALRAFLGRIAGEDPGEVIKTEFEYTPDGPRYTHHDFFASTESNHRFFFEVKFTENGFGGASDRSRHAWPDWRRKLVESLHLASLSEEEFFAEYQVYRIVAEICSERDHVVFLFPFDNPALVLPPRILGLKGVHAVNWSDAVAWTDSGDFARKYALPGRGA